MGGLPIVTVQTSACDRWIDSWRSYGLSVVISPNHSMRCGFGLLVLRQ
jgi:hypothetical protein